MNDPTVTRYGGNDIEWTWNGRSFRAYWSNRRETWTLTGPDGMSRDVRHDELASILTGCHVAVRAFSPLGPACRTVNVVAGSFADGAG